MLLVLFIKHDACIVTAQDARNRTLRLHEHVLIATILVLAVVDRQLLRIRSTNILVYKHSHELRYKSEFVILDISRFFRFFLRFPFPFF